MAEIAAQARCFVFAAVAGLAPPTIPVNSTASAAARLKRRAIPNLPRLETRIYLRGFR
jgi:hypothetical protein